MNCRYVVMVVVAMVWLCVVGCKSEDETSQGKAKPAGSTDAKPTKSVEEFSDAEKAKFAVNIRATLMKSRFGLGERNKVLNDLRGIKEWKISTIKDNKEDEEIAAAVKEGVYDQAIKESLTDVIYLKFFARLPTTIRALRDIKPTPETCDFILDDPRPPEPIFSRLGEEDWAETKTKPEGGEIVWSRYGEVSIGVADGKIRIVRVHVTDEASLWAGIGVSP